MNKENKELIVVKTTVFDKIKKFFKKLFFKKEEIYEAVDENQNKKENDFINRVKIEEDVEKQRLLKLQELIAEDIIKEEELPDDDVKALHKLYDNQILELKKSIDEYREKILKIRMSINE